MLIVKHENISPKKICYCASLITTPMTLNVVLLSYLAIYTCTLSIPNLISIISYMVYNSALSSSVLSRNFYSESGMFVAYHIPFSLITFKCDVTQ